MNDPAQPAFTSPAKKSRTGRFLLTPPDRLRSHAGRLFEARGKVMGVIRFAVGSAVVALVGANQLAHLSPAERGGIMTAARTFMGGTPAARPSHDAIARVALLAPAGAPRTASAASGSGTETIEADRGGQFRTTVEIDGQRLPALVDTGATYLVLSFEDADQLGIRPLPSDFRVPVATANGRALVAQVRLDAVRLGSITVRDVAALVAGRGQMSGSLLGMSFLSRLSSVKVGDGRLVLAP